VAKEPLQRNPNGGTHEFGEGKRAVTEAVEQHEAECQIAERDQR
jgi:hypothetical protein